MCRPIQSVVILVIDCCAVVRFCYHSYDYRPNWTPLSPITITKHGEKWWMMCSRSLVKFLCLIASIAVIGVEPAVKYSFVYRGTQTRLKDQYNTELTLLPRLHVKPLITAITAITNGLVSEQQHLNRVVPKWTKEAVTKTLSSWIHLNLIKVMQEISFATVIINSNSTMYKMQLSNMFIEYSNFVPPRLLWKNYSTCTVSCII